MRQTVCNHIRLCLAVWMLVVAAHVAHGQDTTASAIDFERHVAPLLGRHGCNSAACHGAFGGKGDLQLSLFGYSAKMDYENLSDFVDTEDPSGSWMLHKPTGIEEHEGGVRFTEDSDTYRIFKQWIAAGAKWKAGAGKVTRLRVEPGEVVFADVSATEASSNQPLKVTAEFADGTRQNVTDYCQFSSRDDGIATINDNGLVQSVRHGDTSIVVSYSNAFAVVDVLAPFPGKQTPTNPTSGLGAIDARIVAKLNKLNVPVSQSAEDAEFLRRVTIDTIGTIPSPKEVVEFCDDRDPHKREKIIDRLLAHPMHAALWATRMCDITKCDVNQMMEDETMRSRRAQMWHDWFRKRFADNVSYAEIARGIVTATSRGDLSVQQWVQNEEDLIRKSRDSFQTEYAQRPALDLYWRRVGDDGTFPLKETTELTAVAFTGIRLECAQCHKHPFDRWTQDDYAGFANLFSNVIFGSSTELNVAVFEELNVRRQAKREGRKVEALPKLREVFISDELGREVSGSDPNQRVAPRALESEVFAEDADLRQQFYEWLVADDNPFFARNFANRVWAVYFGVGLVEPVDDFSISNPPSHPQLLEDLSIGFRKSGFDIRALEKSILMSAAYQRSSTPNEVNRSDRRNFARQYVRPLMAEVALDSINKALGSEQSFGHNAPEDSLAIEVASNVLRSDAGRMLGILGRGQRKSICDCDRRTESDLRQFIFMINDKSIHEKIEEGSIQELKQIDDNNELVTQLYLRMLGRYPNQRERTVGKTHLSEFEDREDAFEDLVWALINSREFITNH